VAAGGGRGGGGAAATGGLQPALASAPPGGGDGPRMGTAVTMNLLSYQGAGVPHCLAVDPVQRHNRWVSLRSTHPTGPVRVWQSARLTAMNACPAPRNT